MKWWWISFLDTDMPAGDRFVAVVIVAAPTVTAALDRCRELGIDMSVIDECVAVLIPEGHLPPVEYQERLLSKVEATMASEW